MPEPLDLLEQQIHVDVLAETVEPLSPSVGEKDFEEVTCQWGCAIAARVEDRAVEPGA